MKNIKPIGFSPIAYSLKQASENELADARLYDYSIIFITYGGESCNGDVCNTFKEFIEKKTIKQALATRDVTERLGGLGANVVWNTPADFGAFVKAEVAKWGKVAKASGAKID